MSALTSIISNTDFFILLSAILVNSSLAIAVYKNNSKSTTNIIFSVLSLVISAWLIAAYISLLPEFLPSSLFWIRLSIFFAVPMSLLLFLLAHTIPDLKLKISKSKLTILISISAIIMLLNISPITFTGLEIIDGSPNPTPGPGLIPFVIFSLFTSIGTIYLLISKQRKATGLTKEQLRFVSYGILIMLVLIITTIMIPVAVLGSNFFVSFAPLYTLIFLGMTAYSIIRHKLFDIRLVVARAVAYTLLIAVIGIFYTVSTFLVTSIFLRTTTSIGQIALYTILTLLVAFTFQPLRRLLQNVTDKIFYKGRYDSSDLLSNLTKIMATTLGLNDLMGRLLVKMLPEMRISKGAFVLLEKGKVEETKIIGFDKKTEFVGADVISLLDENQTLLADEVNKKKIKIIMKELDATVSVPLKAGNDEIGVLLLGNKLSGEIYSEQDVKVLQILSPEISIAIQNARSFEEIRKFNITLQKEVEKATSDLRDANEKLKELDKLKDEFISIASHELRTPMTAIKSYIWLALHGKRQEQDPRLRDYLNKVYESSERMIAMVNDMLNVSRIETGRLQLEIVPVSVYKIAQQVKDDLSARALETGVEIIIDKEAIVPNVSADTDKLSEIFTNLIGNAIKFTKKGGKITVSTRKVNKMVEVSITDTGIGIAKENIPRLFKKYGKIDESYATLSASTGTGLGLYITKQYLEKMGGGIWVKSVQGKGATFTFSLPVSTGKELSKDHGHDEQPKGVVINPKFLQQTKSQRQEAEG